jgi:hypothetical protein
MERCPILKGKDPILMGSSETDHSSFREVQAEACPKEKRQEALSCIRKSRD